MNTELVPASIEDMKVLKNLMQFYMYDFSVYTGQEAEKNGFFSAYPNLDSYWQEPGYRFPYLLLKEDKYIGFVLIRFIESAAKNYFSIAEFFIMKKYRRQGIGKAAAEKVFDLHKGKWEVFQKENNYPAQAFWKTVIGSYTKGNFTESAGDGKVFQEFEN